MIICPTLPFKSFPYTDLRKADRPHWPEDNPQERQDLRRQASRKDRNYEGKIEVNDMISEIGKDAGRKA